MNLVFRPGASEFYAILNTYGASRSLLWVNQFSGMRRKKGEVVEPAGGETGVPHCLAEAHKLLEAALFR